MATNNDPLDYYFPDTENVSLLESKQADSNTYLPGLISAALLTLVTAASLIIGWIMFARDYSGFLLAFSIVTTIAFLVSLFILFVLFRAFTFAKRSPGQTRAYDLDHIAFIAGICFGAFFLIVGFALFLYRPLHFNSMSQSWSDKSEWESQYGGEFADKWTEGRRLIMALGFLSLGSFVLAAISSMSLYANHPSKFGLNLSLLYLSLFIAFVFALASIGGYLKINSLNIESNGPEYDKHIVALLVLAITSSVLLLLNAIFGLFKTKRVLLIFGFFLLILAFTGVFVIGNFARGFRKVNEGSTFDLGRSVISQLHKNSIGGICNNKYAQSNVGCRKEDSSVSWEDNNGQVLPLNVACYYPAANWYSMRQIQFIIFLLFTVFFAFLAATADFALAKDSTSSDNETRPLLFLLSIVGLMLAFLLAFVIALIFFRYSFEASTMSNSQVELSRFSFRPVVGVIAEAPLTPDGCSTLGEMDLFHLSLDGYYRIALLGQGLRFENSNTIKSGNQNNRPIFFDDFNSKNPYLFTFGDRNTIENSLNNLVICFSNPSANKRLFLYVELLENKSSIDAQGLKPGEKLVSSNLFVENGKNLSETLPYIPLLACNSICKTSYDFNRPENRITVTGRMLVKNNSNQLEAYGVPEAEETLSVYFGGNESTSVLYKNNGVFEFNTYAYPSMEQTAMLRLKDKSGYYLENYVDITIPPREQIQSVFDIGAIQLLSPDGNGCKNAEIIADCYSKSNLKKGSIKLTVRNGVTNAIEKIEIELRKFNSITGPLVSSYVVDSENMNLGTFDYGAYIIKPLSDNFFKMNKKISLQSSEVHVEFVLVPLPEKGVHRFFAKVPTSQNDYDLNLEFENFAGVKCYVNPQSKYCGYARAIQDIRKDQQGFEIVDVEKFTDANYMLYVAPAPFYTGTCPALEAFQQNRKLSTQPTKFDFRKLQQIKGLTADDIQFGIFNSDSQLNSDSSLNNLNVFTSLNTLSDDEVYVINNGSQPVLTSIVLSIMNKYKKDNSMQAKMIQNINVSDVSDANIVLSTIKQTNSGLFKNFETEYTKKIENYKFKEQPVDVSKFKSATPVVTELEKVIAIIESKDKTATTAQTDQVTQIEVPKASNNDAVQNVTSNQNGQISDNSNITIQTPIPDQSSSENQKTASEIVVQTEILSTEEPTLIDVSSEAQESKEQEIISILPTDEISQENDLNKLPTSIITENATSEESNNNPNESPASDLPASTEEKTLDTEASVSPLPVVVSASILENEEELSCDSIRSSFILSLRTDLNISDDQVSVIEDNLANDAISPTIGFDDNAMTASISSLNQSALLNLKDKWTYLQTKSNLLGCKSLSIQLSKLQNYIDLLKQVVPEENSNESVEPSEVVIVVPGLVKCDQLVQQASSELLQFSSLKIFVNSDEDDLSALSQIDRIKEGLASAVPSIPENELTSILQRLNYYHVQSNINQCSGFSNQTKVMISLINSSIPIAKKEQICQNLRIKISNALPLVGIQVRTKEGIQTIVEESSNQVIENGSTNEESKPEPIEGDFEKASNAQSESTTDESTVNEAESSKSTIVTEETSQSEESQNQSNSPIISDIQTIATIEEGQTVEENGSISINAQQNSYTEGSTLEESIENADNTTQTTDTIDSQTENSNQIDSSNVTKEETSENDSSEESLHGQIIIAINAQNEAALYRCSDIHARLEGVIEQIDFQINEKKIDECARNVIDSRQEFAEKGLTSVFNFQTRHPAGSIDTGLVALLDSLNSKELSDLVILIQGETENCTPLQTKFNDISFSISKLGIEKIKPAVDASVEDGEKSDDILNEEEGSSLDTDSSVDSNIQSLPVSEDNKIQENSSGLSDEVDIVKYSIPIDSDEELIEKKNDLISIQSDLPEEDSKSDDVKALITAVDQEIDKRSSAEPSTECFACKEKAQEILSNFNVPVEIFEENIDFKPVSNNPQVENPISELTDDQKNDLKENLQTNVVSSKDTCHSIRVRASGIISLIDFQIREKKVPENTIVINSPVSQEGAEDVATADANKDSANDSYASSLENISAILDRNDLNRAILADNTEEEQLRLTNDFRTSLTYMNAQQLKVLVENLTTCVADDEYNPSDSLNEKLITLEGMIQERTKEINKPNFEGENSANTSDSSEIVKSKNEDVVREEVSENVDEQNVKEITAESTPPTDEDTTEVQSTLKDKIEALGIDSDSIIINDQNEKVDPKIVESSLSTLTEDQKNSLQEIIDEAKNENNASSELKENLVLISATLDSIKQVESVDQKVLCTSFKEEITQQLEDEGVVSNGSLFADSTEEAQAFILSLNEQQVQKLKAILKVNEDKVRPKCPVLFGRIESYERTISLWIDNKNKTYEEVCMNLQKKYASAIPLVDFEIVEKNVESTDNFKPQSNEEEVVVIALIEGEQTPEAQISSEDSYTTETLNEENKIQTNDEESESIESTPQAIETEVIQDGNDTESQKSIEVSGFQAESENKEPVQSENDSPQSENSPLGDSEEASSEILLIKDTTKVESAPSATTFDQAELSQCSNLRSKLHQIPSLISIQVNEGLLSASICTNRLNELKTKLRNIGISHEILQTSFVSKSSDDKELHIIIYGLTQDERTQLSNLVASYKDKNSDCGTLNQRLSNIQSVLNDYAPEEIEDKFQNSRDKFNTILEDVGLGADYRLVLVSKQGSETQESAINQLLAVLNQLPADEITEFNAKIDSLKVESDKNECKDITDALTNISSLVAYYNTQKSLNKTIQINSEVNGEAITLEQDVTPIVPVAELQAEPIVEIENKVYNFREKLTNFFKDANIEAIVKELPTSQKCFFCQDNVVETVVDSGVASPTIESNCDITFNAESQIDCTGKSDQDSCLSLKNELEKFQTQLSQHSYSEEQCQNIQEKLKDILMNFYHNDYCFRAQDKLVKFINLYMDKVSQLNNVSEDDIQTQEEPDKTEEETQESTEEQQSETIVTDEATTIEAQPETSESLKENAEEDNSETTSNNESSNPEAEVISEEPSSEPEENKSNSTDQSDISNPDEETTHSESESQVENNEENKLNDQESDSSDEPVLENSAIQATDDNNTKTHQGESDDSMVIEARRLQVSSNTVTNLPENKFILLNCFTGYGKRSFKILNHVMSSKPTIEICKALFFNSKYRLSNLQTQMPAYE
jgi:hypothetical protein